MPAGMDLDQVVGEAPATRTRGKLRRRLRHLRKVRELLLRDLGGLVFEIHRVGSEDSGNTQGRLVGRKLTRLAQVDAEIAELEDLLSDRRPTVLREPGIGGACVNCGELYGSSARFCWACGTAVAPGHGRRAMAPAAGGYAQLTAASEPQQAVPVVDTRPYVDSDAHPLGEQPTEQLATEQPTEMHDAPTEVLREDPTTTFQAPSPDALEPPSAPSTVDLPPPPGANRAASS